MARYTVLFSISLLLCCVFITQCAKLNVPRVLIPLFNSIQVNFTLEVTDGGCYKWTSSREDIVTVKPLAGSGGCSSSAQVWSASRLRHRHTAIILARDVHSKQVLRCDVIVDTITSLGVVTTTRELFVEEAPEAFEIRAYDDQGNEFTTLEGVDFSWSLVSPLKDNNVIRVMTFAESLYEASDSLHALEARGLRGNTALIEGARTGSAKVIVKLPQREYASVNEIEVTLRVVANLLVVPPDVTILPGDSVKFKIIQVREGRMIEVPQPSQQYWLEIENFNVADLHPQTGVAVGTSIGQTKILLQDAGAGEGEPVRPPEALLKVGLARSLQLAMEPSIPRPWAVEVGQLATIHTHLLDSEGRRMYVGPETRVSVTLSDEKLFFVEWQSINGTVLSGLPRRHGTLTVTATLLSVAGKPIHPKIATRDVINIYNKIDIIPPTVVLPLDPTLKTRQEIQMLAEGGDGSYLWRGDGAAIGVGPAGLVTALAIGTATVTAAMPSNPHIHATASIMVVEPMKLKVVWSQGEGPVGTGLALHVALYSDSLDTSDGEALPYTNCDQMPFEISTIEGVKFERTDMEKGREKDDLIDVACTILYATCSEPGTARVNVKWSKLSQVVNLACHSPLKRVTPEPLLTIGSAANIVFSGGPLTWPGAAEPKRKISVMNSETARVEQFSLPVSTGLHAYTVTCLKLGQTEMLLKVVGSSMSSAEVPSEGGAAEAQATIICTNPNSLRLTLRRSLHTECPLPPSSQVSVLNGGGPAEVEVSVLDSRGKIFTNASSLRVRWSSRPPTILPDLPAERLLITVDEQFESVPITAYHYQMLDISGNDMVGLSNIGEVTLEVIGFRNSVLKMSGVTQAPTLYTRPTATLPFRLVLPVRASVEKLVLFNYQGGASTVTLLHGSGSYRMDSSSAEMARTVLDGQLIKIQPLEEGEMQMTVTDLCVNSPSLFIQVNIVSVSSIAGEMTDLIEKGQTVECLVRLYDRIGTTLPALGPGAPALKSAVAEGHVTIVKATVQNAENGGVKFNVTGVDEGDVRIDFFSGSIKGSVLARVFPPLKLIPRNSVLLPGGSLQLTALGGPPPPALLTYHTGANNIRVSRSGVVEGISSGSAGIEAVAESRGRAAHARATAAVRVIALDGIAIHAPTYTILVGNSLPVWATGVPDTISPLELGSLLPALQFSWAISGDGAATVTDVLTDTNVELDDTDRVAIRIKAVRAGRIILHLNVTADRKSPLGRGSTWYARLDIAAVDPLKILPPLLTPDCLLLAPYSTHSLFTNYDVEELKYSISDENSGSEETGPLVQVDSFGKVTSFGRFGRALITVSTLNSLLGSYQHITIAVEVCPVHYVMMQLDENAGAALSGLGALPQGLSIGLTASRHDALGRRLAGVSDSIRHISNRADLIATGSHHSNSTVELTLAESGRSVLKIFELGQEMKTLSDYVSLKVQSAISPQQVTATVGDLWCMKSSLSKCIWGSSDTSSIWISSQGLAQARTPRPAPIQLFFTSPQSLRLDANTDVLVRPADRIYFLDTAKDHVVTDEQAYIVHLVLSNHEEYDKTSNLILDDTDCMGTEVDYYPFECEVKTVLDGPPAAHLSVEPIFDMQFGSYGCRVKWSPDEGILSDPANATHGLLSVLAHWGSVSSPVLTLRAVRAAAVHPSTLVVFPVAALHITASSEVLHQLTVVSDSDMLKVEGPVKVSETKHRYIIKSVGSLVNAQVARVIVYSPLTHQETEIPVSIGTGLSSDVCEKGGASPVIDFLQNHHTFLLVFVTIAVLFVGTLYAYNTFICPLLRARSTTLPPHSSPQIHEMSFRNVTYQSRSPLSGVSPPVSPQLSSQDSSPSSGNMVYGDPSFLTSPERRRNRRIL